MISKANNHSINQNLHHWMLWVSPDHDQIQQLKSWPSNLKERVLTLKPRQPQKLADTLIQAIETGFYAMITAPHSSLCETDQWRVKQAGNKYNTVITWK